MASFIIPILVVSLTTWVGGLIFNWIRTEIHFRSDSTQRRFVGVVDTAWAERRVLLPSAFVFAAALTGLAALGVESRSISLMVLAILLLVVVVVGATLIVEARQIDRLQVSEGLEDPQVLNREKRFLYAMRVEAAVAVGLLISVGIFLAN